MSALVFKALADDSRRQMLSLLAMRPQTASELAAPFEMSAPAVSQHLSVLKAAGLVSVEKVGTYRVYQLEARPLQEVAHWAERLQRHWNKRLDRLEKVVERVQREQQGNRRGRT